MPGQKGKEMEIYRIAGIDVHKKMLAVVIGDAAAPGELRYENRGFGAEAEDLEKLRDWLRERQVHVVVMESTAQYWKGVWAVLEEAGFHLELAQAQSNKAPQGRKRDFADAQRLVRRFLADELDLSFVPNPEQRLWRTMTRAKEQLVRERVRLKGQLDSFLEECRIRLSSHVTDLLGVGSRRMMDAVAAGMADPVAIAELATEGLRATREQLAGALRGAVAMNPVQRKMLAMLLERLDLIERQIEELDRNTAEALRAHQDAVERLAEMPGIGVDSAQRMIAEVGPQARAFDTAGKLAGWVGCCPGREESAGVSRNDRSPKGNRWMRTLLNQSANAAVKNKGSVFEIRYHRLKGKIGHGKAIWAVAHSMCRVLWKILHAGVRYEERGQILNPQAARYRRNRLARNLRRLGYQVTLTPLLPAP